MKNWIALRDLALGTLPAVTLPDLLRSRAALGFTTGVSGGNLDFETENVTHSNDSPIIGAGIFSGVTTRAPIRLYGRVLVWVLAIFATLGVSRAQSTAKPAGLPPVHLFDETTIPLREFRANFERSLALRAKDIGLPDTPYRDVVAQATEFVELCSSLTAEQVGSTQASSPGRNGQPFYFPPRLQLLEDGKYKDCSRGRAFSASANAQEFTFTTRMSNWDTQQRKFTGPKLHVWAYFKVPVPGPPIGLEEYGKRYGILNAEIYDGTTPASAPPPKSLEERIREAKQRSRPRLVVGEYVCPGTELRVVVYNDVFRTYTDFTRMTVKKPARIDRTDQTGAFFQQAGEPRFYYQIVSGPGSQTSCAQ